jgi:hypothetical protein
VSCGLRQVTEDVFARYFLRTCSITFHAPVVRSLFRCAWYYGKELGDRDRIASLNANPAREGRLCFQPFAFSPDASKSRVLLKLRDEPTTYSASDPGVFAETVESSGRSIGGFNLPEGPSSVFKCQSRGECVTSLIDPIFDVDGYNNEDIHAPAIRRLLTSSHFVTINGTR